MSNHLVFVYGTIRRGGPNHYMLGRSEFIGEHWTEPRYTMFGLGEYPAVVARGETAILGELYRINDKTFSLLDELECYPHVYSRQIINTPSGRAWMYVYNRLVGTETMVTHGDWLRHLGELS